MSIAIRRRAGVGGIPHAQMERAVSAVRGFTSWPFAGVEWSMAYAAFLAYTVCITTFRFPVGTEAMGLALLTLPMERRALRLPPLSIFTFALVGWALIGVTTTAWPDDVLNGVTEFAKVCAVVFVALNVVNSRARLRMYLAVSVLSYMLFPVKGTLINYFVIHETLGGRAIWGYIYNNPNDLAGLTLLQLSIVLGSLEVEKHKFVQYALRISVVPLVLIIFLTQSRGAFIAAVAFVIFWGRHYVKRINWKGIVGLVFLMGVVYLVAPDTVWRRFSTISSATDENAYSDDETDNITKSDQSSSLQRLAIWQVARAVIAENAVTGVGLGAYPLAHYEMQQRAGMPATARGKRDTHSTYLKLLAELGAIGLLLFCAIVITTARVSEKESRASAKRAPAFVQQLRSFQVGMYAYLVAGIWGSYGTLVPTYIHMVVIVSAATILKEEREASEGPPERRQTFGAGRRSSFVPASART